MKKLQITKALFFLAFALCFSGCKEEAPEPAPAPKEFAKSGPISTSANCCWVSTTNDVNDRIEVYDPVDGNWNDSGSLKWSFKPSTAQGYNSSTEIPLWTNPTDVKVRNNTVFGGSQVIAATSYRLATIATYTGGIKKWVMGFGTGVELHGIELLPNGNCVVVNPKSTDSWIRIYSSSQPSPNHGRYYQRWLSSPHGALWDPANNCLWVIGGYLYKMAIGGTLQDPTLSIITTYSLESQWGHDIAPFTGNNDKMWISTNGGVYVFTKSTGVWTTPAGAVQNSFVKGISSQSTGQIIETEVDPACTFDNWCTNHVDFYNGITYALEATRTVTGAAIYKGKSFNPLYTQP